MFSYSRMSMISDDSSRWYLEDRKLLKYKSKFIYYGISFNDEN